MTFNDNLEKYAEVAVKIGANLQQGQRLMINAPIEAADLARALTRQAYRAGAEVVDVNWIDPQVSKIRIEEAAEETLDIVPQYLYDHQTELARNEHALISISGGDPNLMAGVDPKRMQKAQLAARKARKEFGELLGRNSMNWLVIMAPHPVLAQKIFPDVSVDEAVSKLWDAIFTMCRVDQDDPVAAWQAHAAELKARKNYLNEQQYSALHYTGDGTGLTIGLPKNHYWEGAGSETRASKIPFIPNIPTEEVFTLPHRDQVDGVVTSTKPLVLNGTLIEQMTVQFSEGAVVSAKATTGQDALDNLLSVDDGARHLGEVALVPNSSPISQSGLTFFNTLYDENASSHIALGSAYKFSLDGGSDLSDEDFAERGGNISLVHVDFMIGSGDLDIDGIREDGSREPVMRGGEWAF